MRNALVKMFSLVWEISVETGDDNATWQGYVSPGDIGSGCLEEGAPGCHWRDWGDLLVEGAS